MFRCPFIVALIAGIYGCGVSKERSTPFGLAARVSNTTLAIGTASDAENPRLLSATGVFANLAMLTIADGFVPYDLNLPFWSDGGRKQRWFYIPTGSTIDNTGEVWLFPPGSVFVKHFTIPLDARDPGVVRHVETRILISRDDDIATLVYKWNDDQTDAELVEFGDEVELAVTTADGTAKTVNWHIPDVTECHACHGEQPTRVLGFTERQLNRDRLYGETLDHQLRALSHVGFFENGYADGAAANRYPTLAGSATVKEKARSYLAVNCGTCHKDTSSDSFNMDFTLNSDLTTAIGVPPDLDNLDVPDSQIIYAGAKEKSAVWLRMTSTGDVHMPFISSREVDEDGAAVVGRWIDEGAN